MRPAPEPGPRLRLMRGSGGWLAAIEGDVRVTEAFGSDPVPLPFTPLATGEEVRAAVQRLYPHAVIEGEHGP